MLITIITEFHLLIEEGRYNNIPRENKLRKTCNLNVFENDYHVILKCPMYRQLRIILLPKYYHTWPSLYAFKQLLTNDRTSILRKVSKYIYMANTKRDSKQEISLKNDKRRSI